MNAVTLAERPIDTTQLGEISAAWQITPDALMVLGWRQEPAAADGAVSHQKAGSQRGRFHSVAWPFLAASPTAQHFVAALQLPQGEVVRTGETLLLTGQGEPAGVLARLPTHFLDAPAFGVELARLAGGGAVAIARFLVKTFAPTATVGNPDIRTMLYAFLERASMPDGCVEVVGAIEDQCVVLQGWGAPPGPECDAILIGTAIEHHKPHMAMFARADLRGTAIGQVIVLPAAKARDLTKLEVVVLLDRRGLRWRPMIAERRILSGPETITHLRDRLQGFQCDPSTRVLLQTSLRPRFDGRFTLYDGGHPVRLAVDHAAAGTGVGIYLVGWLYDPTTVVTEVNLRGTRGSTTRLDLRWTRIIREDVTDAFRADASLPRPEAGQHGHGFTIHVNTVATATEGESFYLDVSFSDSRCGFVPLTLTAAGHVATRNRLLANVDLYKPSAMQVIEGHLAPFFAHLAPSETKPALIVGSPVPGVWSTAIVVPLQDATLPRALLSQFLRDPLARGEGLVFVYGDNWTDALADSLRSLAGFYGVWPTLLRLPGPITATDALVAAASVAEAKHLLLLDPGVVGRSVGWRPALHAALDASGASCCVSPTVIYEDDSIRFGGTDTIQPLDAAPYVRIRRRMAGMPVSLLAAGDPQPSVTASLTCCLVPREAIKSLGASLGITTTPTMQEADLFMRLRRNKVASIWAPAAQVYAPDRASTEALAGAARVAQLVDGWCLRARLAAEG